MYILYIYILQINGMLNIKVSDVLIYTTMNFINKECHQWCARSAEAKQNVIFHLFVCCDDNNKNNNTVVLCYNFVLLIIISSL